MCEQIELWRKELNILIEKCGESALTDESVIKKGLELEQKFKQWELDHPYCDDIQ